MRPIDFRDATFDELATYIVGQRAAVYKAWGEHAPCTTRQLAERSGIDILNVRPRTNELVILGYVRLVDEPEQTVKGEGIYRVATESERLAWITAQQREARNPQTELKLTD